MTSSTSIQTPELVAFDESGNTGQNLLDTEQPVFVTASVRVSDDAAREVANALTGGREGEGKFSRLRRSAEGRKQILDALKHPSLVPENVRMSVYHKRFMVTSKIVDMLVEPLFYRSGMDFYEGGQNLAFANMLHAVTGVFCGPREFDELLRRFVELVRHRTPENINLFYEQVSHMRVTNRRPDFDSDLEMLLASRDIVYDLVHDNDPVALDPAIPCFVELAAQWSAALGVPFKIVHDRSKPLEHEKEYLETLMSAAEPGKEFPNYGPTWRLPILTAGFTLVDSAEVFQVQVADVLSGAAATVMGAQARGQMGTFEKEILESPFGQLSFNRVWPTTAITPDELNADKRSGSASLEYLMEISRRSQERSR